MKTTDYSKLASRYDKNLYRSINVELDPHLKNYIKTNNRTVYDVLDLSCGTGLYLAHQIKHLTEQKINWNGLDASKEMLEKANEKLEKVSLLHGFVEDMPYPAQSFDYIANTYAFHHYRYKEQALDEIYRVLRPNGVYLMHNIAVDDMPRWWLYHYFPTAQNEDQKRFWDKVMIFEQLNERGFKVDVKIDYQLGEVKVADYLPYAENRDISVLTLISDEQYQEGLERMRRDVMDAPDKTVVNDFAEMRCVAKKV
ncbi:class I SAM-dependent methyltransferase [Halobacillus sp. BBL2006]|uniref:class I SAM-dependent methyltransferase n=1 Tax=Halobacillus sp. BBL2006 TaxID=1543706 RepID=UPI0005444980|nr:class I SAM-dependent methyltransferase [Halobacillus sp. BBL2006]KHE73199.1 methylase [Halobacillus sp. BBL2006]